jgi:glycosyltransferase involved in cell wall biosynthesis
VTTQRRLRIGYVYDGLYPELKGGAERRYHELAKRLSQDHDVHYVTWRHWAGPSDITRDGVSLHAVGRPREMYGPDGKRTIDEAVAFAARLVPVLLRQRFDVVDCSATPYVPLYACWLATRLTRTPMVTTWHEFWGDYWLDYLPDRPTTARLARGIEGFGRHFGDVLVPVSPFTARRLGVDPADRRVRVVGNGVPLDEIAAATPSVDPYDLVFVGRLIDDKRVDLLIEAMALLEGRVPDLRCLVIGDGPERTKLEALTERLGLADRIRFSGRLDDASMYGFMKAARVFVQPSTREGFGITVVEAQACGAVPVVVRSTMSAASDLVHDGVDGVLCDPTSSSMAAAIAGLIDHPRQLAKMRLAARKNAQPYSWDAIAAQMESVYAEAAAAPVSREAMLA